jgi:two-component system sensor histidine kinase KdpD
LYLETCEKLSKQFGSEFIRVDSNNITQAIAATAKKYYITQVVLGQTQRSRWQLFLRSSPVQELLKVLHDVDLHIISTSKLSSN